MHVQLASPVPTYVADPVIWLPDITVWAQDDAFFAVSAKGKISRKRLAGFGLDFTVSTLPETYPWAGMFRKDPQSPDVWTKSCKVWQVKPNTPFTREFLVDQQVTEYAQNKAPNGGALVYFVVWGTPEPFLAYSKSLAGGRNTSGEPLFDALMETYPLQQRRNLISNHLLKRDYTLVAKTFVWYKLTEPTCN